MSEETDAGGQKVWYAAYGSNLSRERFEIYLCGGKPEGATHTFPGCRDRSPPEADATGEIPGRLAFGGWSETWGGGVAFLQVSEAAHVKARLYLTTLEQFEDIVAQENWLVPGTISVTPSEEQLVLDAEHTYRLVIPLGLHDGLPVLTISQLADTETAAPTEAYLRYIAHGLRESHELADEDIVAYLATAAGAPPPEDIARALS